MAQGFCPGNAGIDARKYECCSAMDTTLGPRVFERVLNRFKEDGIDIRAVAN